MTREEINKEKHKEIKREKQKETIKKVTKITVKLLLFIFITGTLFFSYTTYISTVKIHTREYRIIDNKIPDNFNGTKIAHFSDLHFGTTMNLKKLKEIITKINETNPDIIVFTGDLIDKNYTLTNTEQEKIIKELNKLNSSLGKYAILGEEDNDNFNPTCCDSRTFFNNSDFLFWSFFKSILDSINFATQKCFNEGISLILLCILNWSIFKSFSIASLYLRNFSNAI